MCHFQEHDSLWRLFGVCATSNTLNQTFLYKGADLAWLINVSQWSANIYIYAAPFCTPLRDVCEMMCVYVYITSYGNRLTNDSCRHYLDWVCGINAWIICFFHISLLWVCLQLCCPVWLQSLKFNSSLMIMLMIIPCFNSLRPSDAYMRQWTRPSLIQMMACRLISAKPVS